jgi:hypothetical protein
LAPACSPRHSADRCHTPSPPIPKCYRYENTHNTYENTHMRPHTHIHTHTHTHTHQHTHTHTHTHGNSTPLSLPAREPDPAAGFPAYLQPLRLNSGLAATRPTLTLLLLLLCDPSVQSALISVCGTQVRLLTPLPGGDELVCGLVRNRPHLLTDAVTALVDVLCARAAAPLSSYPRQRDGGTMNVNAETAHTHITHHQQFSHLPSPMIPPHRHPRWAVCPF